MKCVSCNHDDHTVKFWLVKKLPTKEVIMCDWCKEDYMYNPMTEILPRRNSFMAWLRRNHVI